MLKGQAIGITDALLIALVGMVVVIAMLAIIAVFILLLSKIFAGLDKVKSKKKSNEPAVSAAQAAAGAAAKPAGRALPETESQGELKLQNVDDPTAAAIMAIVSNQSGIPLNRLSFKSIKLIEEK